MVDWRMAGTIAVGIVAARVVEAVAIFLLNALARGGLRAGDVLGYFVS